MADAEKHPFDAAGRRQEMGTKAKTGAEETAGEISEVAGQLYDHAKSAAQETVTAVKKHAAPMDDLLRKTVEESPYTAVFFALAFGWLIGHIGATRR